LPAGDKAGPGTSWKTEELSKPLQHRVLDDRRRRRKHEETRVLIPSAGEPISADAGGNASADYEAEEARPTGGDNSRVGASRQLLDHLSRWLAVFWQRPSERGAHRVRIGAGAHRATTDGLQVPDCRSVRRVKG
jgi:hypothetical protein